MKRPMMMIIINAAPPTDTWGYFLSISPGWLNTMKMRLIDGRDFKSTDSFPGQAIVSQTFVKTFFNGVDPIGRTLEIVNPFGSRHLCRVIGVVPDATYSSLHKPILPVAYVSLRHFYENGAINSADGGTFLLRTSGINPLSLAPPRCAT